MYHYLNCCVSTTGDDVETLIEMIDDCIDITRKTFLKHVDRDELKELEESLGYSRHSSQGISVAIISVGVELNTIS